MAVLLLQVKVFPDIDANLMALIDFTRSNRPTFYVKPRASLAS
jgi:hypothetical protein